MRVGDSGGRGGVSGSEGSRTTRWDGGREVRKRTRGPSKGPGDGRVGRDSDTEGVSPVRVRKRGEGVDVGGIGVRVTPVGSETKARLFHETFKLATTTSLEDTSTLNLLRRSWTVGVVARVTVSGSGAERTRRSGTCSRREVYPVLFRNPCFLFW